MEGNGRYFYTHYWTLAFLKFASGRGRFQTCPYTRLKYNFRQSPAHYRSGSYIWLAGNFRL
jgi:hypothetical protein